MCYSWGSFLWIFTEQGFQFISGHCRYLFRENIILNVNKYTYVHKWQLGEDIFDPRHTPSLIWGSQCTQSVCVGHTVLRCGYRYTVQSRLEPQNVAAHNAESPSQQPDEL